MRPARQFLCVDCEHVWRTAFGSERPVTCPRCGSPCFGRLTWSAAGGAEGWQQRGARRTAGPAEPIDPARRPWGVARREDHAVG